LQVKFQFIQSYSSQNLTKTFYSNQLLGQYEYVNNHKKTQLKRLIQESFQQALKNKIIQNYCQIEFKNKKIKPQYVKIQELNPLLIEQSNTIGFYERLFQ
jgi:uncharacterized protein YpiB (UPF0302 family)